MRSPTVSCVIPRPAVATIPRSRSPPSGTTRRRSPPAIASIEQLGITSPLGRIYDLEGSVLLLGVGHDRNTSLHLAEYLATWPSKRTRRHAAAVSVDGERRWVTFTDLDIDESDFPAIGAAFEATGSVRHGRVGHATAVLMPQRALVDFGATWMAEHRR